MPENNQILSVEGQLVGMPLAGPESFSQQQLDYLKRALGVDETVLWSGTLQGSNGGQIDLSEPITNFTRVRITYRWNHSVSNNTKLTMEAAAEEGYIMYHCGGYNPNDLTKFHCYGVLNFTVSGKASIVTAGQSGAFNANLDYHGSYGTIYKIEGIKRISGGN